MKAYLLNLDSRPDRLERFAAQADALGLPFVRLSAVDGTDPSIASEAERRHSTFTSGSLGPFAFACFESHRKAWHILVDGGDPYAVILEDDVVLATDFPKCLAKGWIPASADICKLETKGTRMHLDRPSEQMLGKRRLRRLRSRHLGSAAYVISRSAAQRLLEWSADAGDPIDEFLFNPASPAFPQLETWQVDPAPAIQGERLQSADKIGWLDSSIHEDRVRRAKLATGGIARKSFLRRAAIRVTEEARALVRGTHYVTVPYR